MTFVNKYIHKKSAWDDDYVKKDGSKRTIEETIRFLVAIGGRKNLEKAEFYPARIWSEKWLSPNLRNSTQSYKLLNSKYLSQSPIWNSRKLMPEFNSLVE